MTHPSSTEIEDFVSGAAKPSPELIGHLSTCNSCADAFRTAARVEVALYEAGDAVQLCVACGCVANKTRCSSCGAALRVGNYRIDKLLAAGPLGRVYAATDSTGARVAVKELAFVGSPSSEALASFEREARVLERLAHPGIPRFVDSFAEGRGVDARAYLVQELIEGESLATRLERQQLDEAEVRDIARQVLDILVYLQSLSPMVFHRDIKPANLIRRPDGSIALVDFGAARDLGSTAGATLVGTFGYMPIEQLAGIVDATTDLHALGATLWRLATRIDPWRLWADSLLQRRANISPSLRRFLDRLVERDARRRFSGAKAAQHALGGASSAWRVPSFSRWAAAALLFATGVGGFSVAHRFRGFAGHGATITPASSPMSLSSVAARAQAIALAKERVERAVERIGSKESLRVELNAQDDAALQVSLDEANRAEHLDALSISFDDGKDGGQRGVSVGKRDAEVFMGADAAFPATSGKGTPNRARSVIRHIGTRTYALAEESIEYFGRKIGTLMGAQAIDGESLHLSLSGHLAADYKTIDASAAGPLAGMRVKVGDEVKRGQVRAEIVHTNENTRRLNKAKLNLVYETRALEVARKRSQPPSEVVGLAESAKSIAEDEFHAAQDELRVIAPCDGRVENVKRDSGAVVKRGEPVVGIVARDLIAEAQVDETDLQLLYEGQSATIEGDALQRPYHGQIVRLGTEVNRATGTVKVFIQLGDTDARLLPGMSVKVTLED